MYSGTTTIISNFNEQYEFIKCLGKGAFGTVSAYRNREDNLYYALKIMEITTDIIAFEREAKILAIISKDNTENIKYHGTFIYSDDVLTKYFVIVMEYIDGFTLKQYIEVLIFERRTASAHFVYNLMIFLFTILSAIHKLGFVHRDIKPENIMIDTVNERFILLDFGLSMCFEESFRRDMYRVQGTMEFIAPERFHISESYDVRNVSKIDIWSTGVLLYNLIEKHIPWSINYSQSNKDRTLLKALITEISGSYTIKFTYPAAQICNMISTILDRNPNTRPTSDMILSRLREMVI